jgi:ribosomal protein S6
MKGKINYQVIVEFSPKAEEKNKQSVLEKVNQWFESKTAKVIDTVHTGTKQLAYEIQKFEKADFWELTVESAKPIKLTEVNVMLNREPQVIRYLVLKK